MLPVLFQIVIPSGWTWAVAIGIALAIVGSRAFAWVRQARRDYCSLACPRSPPAGRLTGVT